MSIRRDMRRYHWTFRKSFMVNLWWRVEHLGVYRGGDGGMFGYARRFGYTKRKAAERT
jgi:hypothetical protein